MAKQSPDKLDQIIDALKASDERMGKMEKRLESIDKNLAAIKRRLDQWVNPEIERGDKFSKPLRATR